MAEIKTLYLMIFSPLTYPLADDTDDKIYSLINSYLIGLGLHWERMAADQGVGGAMEHVEGRHICIPGYHGDGDDCWSNLQEAQ